MNILPHDTDTLVVSRSASDVQQILGNACIRENLVRDREEHLEKLFVGSVAQSTFEFSIRPKRPNSFLPRMIGTVEGASSGSILFVSYELFPSTKLYLSFWSLFVLVAGIVSTFNFTGFIVPAATVFVLLFIHYIAWANFNMQVRISREILLKSLN